jgi:gliding motility-associated-like protein
MMKRLLPLLVFFIAVVGLTKVYAQPTVYIFPEFDLITAGETSCVEFRTADFTDILEMRFSVRWDPDNILFTGVTPGSLNPNVTNLDLSDFDISQVDEGILTFIWKSEDVPDGDCPDNSTGVTLFPDDQVLFELCFEGITGYSTVEITGDPEPIFVTREGSCPQDIMCFCNTTEGFIAVDNLPIEIDVPFADGNEGETVCFNLSVQEFIDIVSLQFTVTWLPQVLEFESVQGLNLPWPGSSFNPNQTEGWMTVSWFNSLNPNEGVTVADGTDIIQLCFNIIGSCGQVSPIEIEPNPTPIEVTNESDPGTDIGVLDGSGQVSVNCIIPGGVNLILPDADICPGESFCMDVTAENFNDLEGVQFSLGWNPSVISFQNITNINPNLFLFDINDFNTAGSATGVITVDWDDPSGTGATLNDGDVLFTVCYESVNGGGINTTVAVINEPVMIEALDGNGVDIGVNNFNGLVDVCSPPGITLVAPALSVDPGDQICVPIEVQDFDGIESMSFTTTWETSVLEFTGVQNFAFPSLTAANFDDSNAFFGALCVDWDDPSGLSETLPDGSVLFEMCFTAVGEPFECSEIDFVEFPCPIDVITGESNGFNVGVNAQAGEVCMNNPFNFTVSIDDASGIPGSTVCVDVAVENFISLETVDFSLNWDPTIIDYDGLIDLNTLSGFGIDSYDDSNAASGQLTINWDSPNIIGGNSLANGTAIFQLCFDIEGLPGECAAISVTNNPLPIQVISANSGSFISLLGIDGEICVDDLLSFVSINVAGVDCPGDNTGAIDISVIGGSGDYSFSWVGPSIIVPTQEDQTGLVDGTYTVIVSDNQNPGLILEETIEVGLSALAPVADAGDDVTLPCGEVIMQLDGSGSSIGGQYEYLWTGGGLVDPDTEDSIIPTIIGSGEYFLEVTDIATGCIVRDTIIVNPSIVPAAVAATVDMITCDQDTVALSGFGSSEGMSIEYEWTNAQGGVVASTANQVDALGTEAGWYFIQVTDLDSGCDAIDSVEVMLDTISPIAIVEDVTEMITCDNSDVLLDGSGSSTGIDYTYLWLEGADPIASTITTNVTEEGLYQLIVTDTTNGCFTVTSAFVEADTEVPMANATADDDLTCVTSIVTLSGAGSSTGAMGDYEYAWSGPGLVGGTEDQLDAEANAPGEYQLTVTDNANGCTSISNITIVDLDIEQPTAEAGIAADSLDCITTTLDLNGSGSSTGLPGEFTYLWTGPDVEAGEETSLTPTINAPGTYFLEVTTASNGCTAIDSVVVINTGVLPTAFIADPDQLDCENSSVTLDASGSSQGTEFQYIWSGPFCINTTDPLAPTVICPGIFELEVINTDNGCSSTFEVEVIEDSIEPTASAEDATFSCTDVFLTIDGSGSSQGTQYTYQWTDTEIPPNNIVSGENTLSPVIDGPGAYGLLVTDTTNGCFATTLVIVEDLTDPPLTNAGPDQVITCNVPTVQLVGMGPITGDIDYEWQLNGMMVSDDPTYFASEGGEYILIITNNDDGCVNQDTVLVDELTDDPFADAGPDAEIGCTDDEVLLDGSNSEDNEDIDYLWSVLTGSGTLDAGSIDENVTFADGPGFFILTLTNSATGCVGTDTVEVVEVIGLPLADAEIMGDSCDAQVVDLMANLPAGTTGLWSVNTSAAIDDLNEDVTFATDLPQGPNSFTWTLSAPGCEDYSSSTVEIFVQPTPVANNDFIMVGEDDEAISFNILDNDLTLGVFDFSYTLLDSLVIGSLEDQGDGNFIFTPSPFFEGELSIPYLLCNDLCPDLCDTADIRINIERSDDEGDDVPNGITPNDDGVNDALIFDILLIDPDKYPDNEIVIFNRWGDIIFEQAPYENDWRGTNQNEDPLPAGTYYYILRLDVAEGDILRGDITILR